MENICKYNTFIFNWVESYTDKVEHIREAFEILNNKVYVFSNLTYKELVIAVDRLKNTNFELFNYIVIIILDNTCDNERFIRTSDGIEVLLNSEVLTVLQTNRTLQNKPRLFVTQKLFDFHDFDDDGDDATAEATKKVTRRYNRIFSLPYYKNMKTLYQGLTVAIRAKEFSKNFQNSPFIETFCNEFKTNAATITMDKMYENIFREIKTHLNYRDIDIEFETNQTKMDSLVFGTALNSDELRDFFRNI